MILKKYKREGIIVDKAGSGRKFILIREQMEFIDVKMEKNDELIFIGEI